MALQAGGVPGQSGEEGRDKDLTVPRQSGQVVYPLAGVLLPLLAVLAGAETIAGIARFGEQKLDLPRRFCT